MSQGKPANTRPDQVFPAEPVEAVASPEQQSRLTASLNSQPMGLVVGAICGLAAAWTCAVITGWQQLWWLAGAQTAVAAIRLSLALITHLRGREHSAEWLQDSNPVLPILFSALSGLIAALVLLGPTEAGVQVLAVACALALCAGVSVRSAGSPHIAIARTIATLAPVTVACAVTGEPALIVLAALLPVFTIGLSAVTLTLFRQLAQQVETADDNLRAAEFMRQQAQTDEVTGFANRSGLRAELELLDTEVSAKDTVLLLRFDLNRFRALGSTLGPTGGDRWQQEIARRLREEAPDGSVLARFGGGEFVMACRVSDPASARRLTAKVCEAMDRALRIDGTLIDDGAVAGAALYPQDADQVTALLPLAEQALTHAKANGITQPVFYDASMTREKKQRREIEDELRAAILRDELSIYFQPIIDLASGEIRAFEALVRWFHPEHGELPPAKFIPVAEETGLIITLGNWITAQAARAASRWPEHVTLAVNLSPVQIRAPGAALGILAALREAGLDPARLELEVTESLFEEDDANIVEFMAEMTREGVGFTLDDFGTGSSALRYIHRYPFRSIKVDRSFVSGPRLGRESDAIIRAVAEMGKTLSMEIVAEGLETIEQVQKVQLAGCTLGQGYYFSRPVPDYMAVMLLAEESQDGARVAV